MRHRSWLLGIVCMAALNIAGPGRGEAPQPPPVQPPVQTADGPGGCAYAHAAVTKSRHGAGGTEFWLFEPADPAPQQPAPAVVFLHGWGGMNPAVYGAWIEHLVRRGAVVIYPRYQADLSTPPAEFLPNAAAAVQAALALLTTAGHTAVDRERMAVVGHSAGGNVAAALAAGAAAAGLPVFKAVMCVEPGKSWTLARKIAIGYGDPARIPAGTLLLAVAGDADRIVEDRDARAIVQGAVGLPRADRELVVVHSDARGATALKADHFAPCAFNAAYDSGEREEPGRLGGRMRELFGADLDDQAMERAMRTLNALDWYGYWKLLDGLTDAAWYDGKNRAYALGDTPELRNMGNWSDGTPVRELEVVKLE